MAFGYILGISLILIILWQFFCASTCLYSAFGDNPSISCDQAICAALLGEPVAIAFREVFKNSQFQPVSVEHACYP